jgi:enoyl-CoA hydratase
LASEKAKFGQPEVGLGIIPGFGGTQRLFRIIGEGKAKELIFRGNIIGADEAYRIGLVEHVYSPDELLPKAVEMAKEICTKGPRAVSTAKSLINQGLDLGLNDGLVREIKGFRELFESADQEEGMKAFLEKRQPEFTGK